MKSLPPTLTALAAWLCLTTVSMAQTPLTPTGNIDSSAFWASYIWNGYGPGNYTTGNIGTTNPTLTTEVFFHSPTAGYQVHDDWLGTFTITGTIDSNNDSSNYAGYLNSGSSTNAIGPLDASSNQILGTRHGFGAQSWTSGGGSTWTYDFTNLVNGYLPAGTMIMVEDLDAWSMSLSTTANAGPLTISSSTSTPYLEMIYQGKRFTPDAPNGIILPTVTFEGSGTYLLNSYHDIAQHLNNPSDLTIFITTQDIQDLTMFSWAKGGAGHSVYMYAPETITPVPEPSSAILLGLTGSLAFLRRRRR